MVGARPVEAKEVDKIVVWRVPPCAVEGEHQAPTEESPPHGMQVGIGEPRRRLVGARHAVVDYNPRSTGVRPDKAAKVAQPGEWGNWMERIPFAEAEMASSRSRLVAPAASITWKFRYLA